ncbi:hypothetical protein [Pseudoxanthomonas sp.]|jgi:hypothetical protein|uniref:hypothetical protein n=1 Tax=Pseudoxanthomonas sp. TaxID=1871049 RepID=UPI002FE3670D
MESAKASAAGSAFVTVTAKVSIAIGIVATLYATIQVVMAWLLLGQVDTDALLGFLATQAVPATVRWIVTHLTTLATGFLLVSAAFLAVSIGLLHRRRWGWWGFVFFMVAGAGVNFAGIAAVDAAFSWVQALPPQPGIERLQAELAALRLLTLATLWLSAFVFAVLHGLVVWQLSRPAVRAEFGMATSPR